MIIELSDDQPPRLVDADRLDQLHAVLNGEPGDARFDELCQPGPDDDHVWIDVSRLRADGIAQVDDPTYAERFDAMIAYAQRKGWLEADGTRVRAHLER
jgi:hypothetical protein